MGRATVIMFGLSFVQLLGACGDPEDGYDDETVSDEEALKSVAPGKGKKPGKPVADVLGDCGVVSVTGPASVAADDSTTRLEATIINASSSRVVNCKVDMYLQSEDPDYIDSGDAMDAYDNGWSAAGAGTFGAGYDYAVGESRSVGTRLNPWDASYAAAYAKAGIQLRWKVCAYSIGDATWADNGTGLTDDNPANQCKTLAFDIF